MGGVRYLHRRGPLTVGGSLLTVAPRSSDVEHPNHLVEAAIQSLTVDTEAQTVGAGKLVLETGEKCYKFSRI